MSREPGYYWVKRSVGSDWEVARWHYNEWGRIMTDDSFSDEQFYAIGYKISEPEE